MKSTQEHAGSIGDSKIHMQIRFFLGLMQRFVQLSARGGAIHYQVNELSGITKDWILQYVVRGIASKHNQLQFGKINT